MLLTVLSIQAKEAEMNLGIQNSNCLQKQLVNSPQKKQYIDLKTKSHM